MQRKGFKQRAKDLWNYFSLYEKIWFFSILILAVVFSFVFPEADDNYNVVDFDKSAYVSTTESFDTLDFSGTVGEFVINEIRINGKAVKLKWNEFTVDGSDPETLKLQLPEGTTVTANDKLSFSRCWQDSEGDDDVWCVSLVNSAGNKLFSAEVTMEDGVVGVYTVEEKSDYLVPVQLVTILYLADVILNIACELLISKQSKWNFIVSLGVEVTEIIICIVCAYRFATLATTLLFWIPVDIISFVVWNRHPDEQKEEITVVKKLTPWQDVLIVLGIAVWTVGVGYLLTFIDIPGGVFANNTVAKQVACYLDACASAVGMVNGLLILFRYREQWIAWYICAIIETVINIMAGQWILLVLKLGYLTNTTYGYIKWTKYIKERSANAQPEQSTQPVTAE